MTLTYNISQSLIDRYSAAPSASKITEAANLQTTIREVLGTDDWDTFLQGSYKNSTALPEMNDVDIVARRKNTNAPLSALEWESLFNTIARRLRASYRITGSVSLGNKCVKLTRTGLNADIVPAAAIGAFTSDPIAIWSRRQRVEIPNYPRTHYDNGVAKQRATNDTFKPTVRLFKRWAKQYREMETIAPSFYIECAVHEVPNDKFYTYLPLGFAAVGAEICSWTRAKYLPSVAGDKDILKVGEWNPDDFERFQARLGGDLRFVVQAIEASTTTEANRLWKLAFGNQ